MDVPFEDLDWTLLKVFACVARTGSLSGAARALGSSQPTVGRQVHALEKALGVELFFRQPRGLAITQAGRTLLPHAIKMAEAAAQMRLAAAGADPGLSGTVRITASVAISHYVLPAALAELRETAPLLHVDLVPSDRTENLLFREADVALRMYRPKQLDMITRHLGDLPIGIFAAQSYLARKGRPTHLSDLKHHDLIGYDRSDLLLRGMRALGVEATRDSFVLRTDNQSVYWEMVRAGCGIGFGQVSLVREEDQLERLLPEVQTPGLPVWLTAPEVLRHTPRVDCVWQALERAMLMHIRAAKSSPGSE
ncbi:LysR family transcriptional regulator [Donghicola sp. XS_ASV15]|uniref:LysR family transcriptional regulator n=1 Tax=Donghicola sp. XS_ASV15 TaxID=3241295 RepID=UPI003518FCCE